MKKVMIISLVSVALLSAGNSFAEYAEGTCLKTVQAEFKISTCTNQKDYFGKYNCAAGWSIEKTIEFKYTRDPAAELSVPAIRSWNYFPANEARVFGGSIKAPTARLFLQIPQYNATEGLRSIEIENIGWDSWQRYEIGLSAKVGIDGLKAGFSVENPLNPALIGFLMDSGSSEKPYAASLTLSDLIFADCKTLAVE